MITITQLTPARVDDANHVVFWSAKQLWIATSGERSWASEIRDLQLSDSQLSDRSRSQHSGRAMSLFQMRATDCAILHTNPRPLQYALELLSRAGESELIMNIPFYWIDQITHRSGTPLYAITGNAPREGDIFGPKRACLIDSATRRLLALPCDAVSIWGADMYYTAGGQLRRIRLPTPYEPKESFSLEGSECLVASGVPPNVRHLDLGRAGVWVFTDEAVVLMSNSTLRTAHRWKASVFRVAVCGRMLFGRGVGPDVEGFDSETGDVCTMRISGGQQARGFDVVAADEGASGSAGLLAVCGPSAGVEFFRWECS
jgi:hypothetical protein